jgi:hypothetical protein
VALRRRYSRVKPCCVADDQHGLELVDQALFVALGRVRQPDHADQLAAVEQRQTQKGRQGRGGRGAPAAARIVPRARWRSPARRYARPLPNSVSRLWNSKPPAHALEQGARLLAPGEMSLRPCMRRKGARPRRQHLADEAVLAAGSHQQVEHRLEGVVPTNAPTRKPALQRAAPTASAPAAQAAGESVRLMRAIEPASAAPSLSCGKWRAASPGLPFGQSTPISRSKHLFKREY